MFDFLKGLFRSRIPIIEIYQENGAKILIPCYAIQSLQQENGKTKVTTSAGEFYVTEPLEVFYKRIGKSVGRLSYAGMEVQKIL
ncbi:MAG: hypothetical protein FWE67_05205 [Planctomycetaceae bacterium]|nr:hypothetical protein [Planctomycetaceae bacterium]